MRRKRYFYSPRDGNRCVWAQKLDPATEHPVGAPFAVLHLHGARKIMRMLNLANMEISVARK